MFPALWRRLVISCFLPGSHVRRWRDESDICSCLWWQIIFNVKSSAATCVVNMCRYFWQEGETFPSMFMATKKRKIFDISCCVEKSHRDNYFGFYSLQFLLKASWNPPPDPGISTTGKVKRLLGERGGEFSCCFHQVLFEIKRVSLYAAAVSSCRCVSDVFTACCSQSQTTL